MKARVIATGEIVEVEEHSKYLECGWKYRDINTGTLYKAGSLDFSDEAVVDYWTRLEHTYAGMAMQGILNNPQIWRDWDEKGLISKDLEASDMAHYFAHALVEKYKKEDLK